MYIVYFLCGGVRLRLCACVCVWNQKPQREKYNYTMKIDDIFFCF